VLAYALLEWILIALLLANGVFSYLISRFAAFFCLAPLCALCSRLGVDSLFETRPPHHRGAEPLRRLLCDAHAAELSRLGYCSAHRRLADAGDMCEEEEEAAMPNGAASASTFPWIKKRGRRMLRERREATADLLEDGGVSSVRGRQRFWSVDPVRKDKREIRILVGLPTN
jgi:hypothetical protein